MSKSTHPIFDTDLIQDLAVQALEQFKSPDTIFLSPNVWAIYNKIFLSSMRYTAAGMIANTTSISPNIMQFNTSAGTLRFKVMPDWPEDIIHVGTESDVVSVYKKIFDKVTKEFEELVFEDPVHR